MKQLGYDKTSIASIFEYSKKLIGHSLRELVSKEEQRASNLQGQGKGGLGQMIEELFFHYPINSDHAPDFREAGMDLKATGLKKLVSGELQIKERLVCDMIDYEAVVNETFETPLFYIKCHIMLLIFTSTRKTSASGTCAISSLSYGGCQRKIYCNHPISDVPLKPMRHHPKQDDAASVLGGRRKWDGYGEGRHLGQCNVGDLLRHDVGERVLTAQPDAGGRAPLHTTIYEKVRINGNINKRTA